MEVDLVNLYNKTSTVFGSNTGREMSYYIASELPDAFTSIKNYKRATVIDPKEETPESQIYSLGCVLYQMTTNDGPLDQNYNHKPNNPFL